MAAQVLYSVNFREDFDQEPTDKEEVALIAIIGERLKWARRDLCKFTIKTAAQLLEIEPKYLNELEQGFNNTTVPLKILKKAAEIYQVSVDYLFGLNEDWEIAPDVRAARDVSTFLLEHRMEMFSQAAAKHLKQQRHMDKLGGLVNSLRLELAEVHEAFDRFKEINPEFEDARGGATLQHRMHRANEAAISAQMALIRFKVLPMPETLPEV
jgi:transcriptional regulator with XRE-family HTH domain